MIGTGDSSMIVKSLRRVRVEMGDEIMRCGGV